MFIKEDKACYYSKLSVMNCTLFQKWFGFILATIKDGQSIVDSSGLDQRVRPVAAGLEKTRVSDQPMGRRQSTEALSVTLGEPNSW